MKPGLILSYARDEKPKCAPEDRPGDPWLKKSSFDKGTQSRMHSWKLTHLTLPSAPSA